MDERERGGGREGGGERVGRERGRELAHRALVYIKHGVVELVFTMDIESRRDEHARIHALQFLASAQLVKFPRIFA